LLWPRLGIRKPDTVLWKVTSEQTGEYAYLWEGDWPSQADYDVIHASESWQAAFEAEVFEALRWQQVYNRYVEIQSRDKIY
jgi:hypothetical protein